MRVPKNEADEQLLVEAAQQDPARFAELYDRHFERVYAYIARRAQSREEAQDLTSEVFHHALANIRQFEWRGVPFAAWLYRIAANALADHWRRAGHESGNPGPEPVAEPGASELSAIEERARLFRLVRTLPAEQRRVIEMRFAEEKSIREIAGALRRSEGAVKQLQFRGIGNLRSLFNAKYGASPRVSRKKSGRSNA
ncbi:MAG TPA: RNA polymerase sigma factor [Candidatus Acidoferrales bacterium]|nr:RNA polymerase sigma factor [Candidatus Acidoferrales bacterium]